MKKINNTKCTTFNDLWNDPKLLTSDAKERINFEVALIGKLIEAREKKKLTQKKLADTTGIKQSA
jgi:predicted XRE-type DNA-binding protein